MRCGEQTELVCTLTQISALVAEFSEGRLAHWEKEVFTHRSAKQGYGFKSRLAFSSCPRTIWHAGGWRSKCRSSKRWTVTLNTEPWLPLHVLESPYLSNIHFMWLASGTTTNLCNHSLILFQIMQTLVILKVLVTELDCFCQCTYF